VTCDLLCCKLWRSRHTVLNHLILGEVVIIIEELFLFLVAPSLKWSIIVACKVFNGCLLFNNSKLQLVEDRRKECKVCMYSPTHRIWLRCCKFFYSTYTVVNLRVWIWFQTLEIKSKGFEIKSKPLDLLQHRCCKKIYSLDWSQYIQCDGSKIRGV
jgi:hypothetical protein